MKQCFKRSKCFLSECFTFISLVAYRAQLSIMMKLQWIWLSYVDNIIRFHTGNLTAEGGYNPADTLSNASLHTQVTYQIIAVAQTCLFCILHRTVRTYLCYMMKQTTKPSRRVLLNTTKLVGNLSQTYLTIQLSILNIYWLGMHYNIYVRNRTELNTNQYGDFPCFSTEAELQCWNDNLLLSYIVQSSAKSHQNTYLISQSRW